MFRHNLAIASCLLAIVYGSVSSAEEPPPRPPITRIAYVAFFVNDLEVSKNFYQDFLGYAVNPMPGDRPDDAHVLAVQINAWQQIRLFPALHTNGDRLYHVALETPAPEAMPPYLLATGVPASRLNQDAHSAGAAPAVMDPQSHRITFVPPAETLPDFPVRPQPTDDRISRRLWGVGLLVKDLPPQLIFYSEVLGFRETWRGSRDGKMLNWVSNGLPEGTDYVQFVLTRELPEPEKPGDAYHITLRVPNVDAAHRTLTARATRTGYSHPLTIEVGADNRRRINLFDPDGTRIELLEGRTINGRPPRSVFAPPPGQE